MPASRSASSSQLFTERMTLSLAGIPAGKSAWSRVSRLTLRSGGALERLERLVLATVVLLVRVARLRRGWFFAPCASHWWRLRTSPSVLALTHRRLHAPG